MARSDDEWGPWRLHNGQGCPLRPGTIAEVVALDRFGFQLRRVTTVFGGSYSSWNWEYFPELKKIIRFREKRPKGLKILVEEMSKIDAPSISHREIEKA